MEPDRLNRLRLAVLLAVACATCVLYFPALSSGFFLDDANNLGGLGAVAEHGIFHYVLSGNAGPTGRPLSLLSFSLQHEAWPDSPAAFKTVNLLIHLFCGGLLFLICTGLRRSLGLDDRDGFMLGVLAAGAWLLHPMQLTTVLYAVQRMTQLSTLFTLFGVCLYLGARERYQVERRLSHLLFMGVAVWGALLLAVVSKENGILLPLLIVVINKTLLGHEPEDSYLKAANRLILGIPIAASGLYLALNFSDVLANYNIRPFSMAERLMTESVVLVDYILNILLPRPSVFSLYHDGFPVSRGLLAPPATLASLLTTALLLMAALTTRRRLPVFSFAVLWFFAGHLLESTYLPLELYYEHRNYLPSAGIFLFLAFLAVRAMRTLRARWVVYAGIAAYSVLIIANTVFQVRLWSDPVRHHMEMVQNQPASRRAAVGLGNQLIALGRVEEAANLYKDMAARRAEEIYPRLKLVSIKGCVAGLEVDAAEWHELITRAAVLPAMEPGLMEELTLLAASLSDNDCRMLSPAAMTRLIVTLALNPSLRGFRPLLHELAARLGLVMGDAGVAYHNITEAVKLAPTVPRQVLKIQILMALGEKEQAARSMDVLAVRINGSYRLQLAYGAQLKMLESQIKQ